MAHVCYFVLYVHLMVSGQRQNLIRICVILVANIANIVLHPRCMPCLTQSPSSLWRSMTLLAPEGTCIATGAEPSSLSLAQNIFQYVLWEWALVLNLHLITNGRTPSYVPSSTPRAAHLHILWRAPFNRARSLTPRTRGSKLEN